MSTIVYQVNKKTGAKYAFESISYWDKDKKQPRSKRRYLGKVDPETGDIIPSRGRTSSEDTDKASGVAVEKLYEEIKERDQTITMLRKELDDMKDRQDELLDTIRKIRSMLESI